MSTFNGKIAIVTGGASGIGLGIVKRCLKEGMEVVIADIHKEALEKVANELTISGKHVLTEAVDVTKEEDWSRLVQNTLGKYGKIDFLFSNAGISFNKMIASASKEEWKWIFDVNFWSQLKAIHTVLPVMKKQESGGHIVFTASYASFVSPPTMVPYACTKSALLSLAEGLRVELDMVGESKIKLSVVMPAYVVSNIQYNEHARPEECKKFEDTCTEIDKAVWSKIANDIKEPNRQFGAISADLAAERILDQVKRGFFYIYTHRNYTKTLAYEKTNRMLLDKPIVNIAVFNREYYGRKFQYED
ncbi:MAG: SDR family NAD(P)-dependent oxidoreductase [Dehalobacterium sp.]